MARYHRALISLAVIAAAIAIAVIDRGAAPDRATRTQTPDSRDASASAASSARDFDYYLIAMSWSPSYCDSNPEDREQCGKRGYGFVLHGLWPQYERGGGPRDCAGGGGPDRGTVARTLAFMPSERLVAHQWRAHGRCSGLDAAAYFEMSDRAFARVRVPPELTPPASPRPMSARAISDAFVRANPGLEHNMLAVVCRRRTLAEVRVCVDDELAFRACGSVVRTSCPRDDVRIPASR